MTEEAGDRVVVSAARHRELVGSVLRAVGANLAESTWTADALVEADLRGQNSHGILRLPVIIGRIEAGLAVPGVDIDISWNKASLGSVDAKFGLGHVVAWEVMAAVVERAKTEGLAALVVRNNNHIGSLGAYVEWAVAQGCTAVVMTTSEAMVHPYGGSEAYLGTNPIAVGFPAGGSPFILDMATSETAMGRILDYEQLGVPIPQDWAVDSEGSPTTDPSRARLGAINPFGGPKGYGLGLAVELLAGALASTSLGGEVKGTLDTNHQSTKGDFFLSLDPASLPGGSSLDRRVSTYLNSIRASPAAADAHEVFVPGDRSRALRRSRLASGIPLSVEAWRAATGLETRLVSGAAEATER